MKIIPVLSEDKIDTNLAKLLKKKARRIKSVKLEMK